MNAKPKFGDVIRWSSGHYAIVYGDIFITAPYNGGTKWDIDTWEDVACYTYEGYEIVGNVCNVLRMMMETET